ncbi:MAG: hypothetical protein R2825_27460 [Saprospiraceae bacterium]
METAKKEKNQAIFFQEIHSAPSHRCPDPPVHDPWFDLFEPLEKAGAERVEHFTQSLKSHQNISHLARIPNLLTMMALYHRAPTNPS